MTLMSTGTGRALPTRRDFPFLKHAQELGLIGQGHVRQLVKEERPARGFLHQAPRRALTPVATPFSMPNISLSNRDSGMAVQLTATKGASRRGEW